MLILESGETCPYSTRCPYHTSANQCYGARSDRPTQFNCSHVENGKIMEGGVRLPKDVTGQMQVLID
ncbi:MAG: hypothetical protein ACTSX1_09290 [Candidatus Heimdallarchaeaceae archaeon]